jgi:hypothetical protein
MTELAFRYSIRSSLPGHPEESASVGVKLVNTLDGLNRIDPLIFANWEVMDFSARTSLPLAVARSRIGTIVENNVTRDDFGQPEPYYGYAAVAFTRHAIMSQQINLRIKVGGNCEGDTWLQAGSYKIFPESSIVTYPVFRGAMLAINAIWPPPWACADAFRMDYDKAPLFPNAPLFPYSRFHIPWFAYLSAELAAGVSLPSEILTERTSNDGLLMIATEDRLDPTNPKHLRCARVLAEIMMARTGYEPGGTTPV